MEEEHFIRIHEVKWLVNNDLSFSVMLTQVTDKYPSFVLELPYVVGEYELD